MIGHTARIGQFGLYLIKSMANRMVCFVDSVNTPNPHQLIKNTLHPTTSRPPPQGRDHPHSMLAREKHHRKHLNSSLSFSCTCSLC